MVYSNFTSCKLTNYLDYTNLSKKMWPPSIVFYYSIYSRFLVLTGSDYKNLKSVEFCYIVLNKVDKLFELFGLVHFFVESRCLNNPNCLV